MPETMLYGFLIGWSVGLFLIVIALIVVSYKAHRLNTDDMRDMKDTVKKLSEVIIALKEVVQFMYTKVMVRSESAMPFGESEAIPMKKELPKKL